MPFMKLILISSLALLGIGASASAPRKPARVLACNLGTLTPAQRANHAESTGRLLRSATRRELADGYLFTVDRRQVGVAELSEWVANESRCCPSLDFHLDLPASGPLTLRLDGGIDVKKFLAAEMGL
ncbi:MAG TPA: hypothetical protein VHL58_15195 [Thermoanaerobaculia bacterium]|nr:hypothetical protein [Thermoanaerobaculia bacterium]